MKIYYNGDFLGESVTYAGRWRLIKNRLLSSWPNIKNKDLFELIAQSNAYTVVVWKEVHDSKMKKVSELTITSRL